MQGNELIDAIKGLSQSLKETEETTVGRKSPRLAAGKNYALEIFEQKKTPKVSIRVPRSRR